jgi:hypothetical protein
MNGKSGKNKEYIKKEFRKLFKSMDFIGKKFLADEKTAGKDFQVYFNIYQELGLAWELLSLQCGHWDGYRKTRDHKKACRICGKIKGIDESYYLLPRAGNKIIGRKSQPNSEKTFETKKDATILEDTVSFHGALLNVDVHNSYKSSISGLELNIAAERIVCLKESEINCSVDRHLVHVTVGKNKTGKMKYGGFPWEIKRRNLKKLPVLFDFDEDYNFLGLTIFRDAKGNSDE